MEPGAYKGKESFMGKLPQLIPAGNDPLENTEQEMGQQNPPESHWTVYSPNVLRGNLGSGTEFNNDVRMSVGWNSEATAKQETGMQPMPWMSTFTQQPFLFASGWDAGNDEATPKASDHMSHYPHPSLSLPHPSLSHDFRMSVTLNPRISVGPTPLGHRNWISFTGGTWSGSWGSGIVLPGGQDSQLIIADGSAKLETNYILQTHDSPPAHIVIKTHGWRTGPPEVLAQLADPELADKVDPNNYKFRLFIDMETGDERYRDRVNCGMWVGSGMRKGTEVVYDAYRLS